MKTENMDIQVTKMFSAISKIERPTRLKAEYSYQIVLEGITSQNIEGFAGLLMAEKVEQYEVILGTLLTAGGLTITIDNTIITVDSTITVDSMMTTGGGTVVGKWYEVEVTRGGHIIREENTPGYILNFEITRKELPNTPAVYLKTLKLYLGDTLCDLDTDEVIPINKQTNDIAEMQDRQSDFTAQFKIRKTRVMRALFELSGEVGANTTFPFEKQECRLIQDNIEVITGGSMILDRVDDQYYYVSIYSGSLNFFKEINNLKLVDLHLATTDHRWEASIQAASNIANLDYIYPLCEPSDDSAMCPMTDDGDRIELFGGWIWPFIKVKAIWDEIFIHAGFICEGNILTDDRFLNLFMPITNLKITKAYTDKYLYSVYWGGAKGAINNEQLAFPGASLINGTENFRIGYYYVPFTASYKIQISVIVLGAAPTIELYNYAAFVGNLNVVSWGIGLIIYEIEYAGTAVDRLTFLTTAAYYYYYSVSITEINNAKIGFGSAVTITPRLHLPDMTQTEFIKTICNMFGLIPEVNPRDRKIKFWNYLELYDNIAIARNWSAYLSEREDETEFKFGDYAQSNYLKYKESDDVIKDNGKGTMLIKDETLPEEKDVIELSVSTCDEVQVFNSNPIDPVGENISRIAFNDWYDDTGTWKQNDSIDARIVFIRETKELLTSPSYHKSFGIRDTLVGGISYDTPAGINPKIATSIDVSFSNLMPNYAGLSRMLTKTNLRRAKFNLPVYEVAGLKHYIPIYLSQYKAYFYVNKINNYVPGKLCMIDLIKL
jgi:hypothetical protein